jgi:hypothetical protein
MKKLIIYFLIMTLSSAFLSAQSPDKSNTAWIISSDLPKGINNSITLKIGDKLSEIILSKRGPSEPIKIPTDGIISILQKLDNPENPSKPSYVTLSEVKIDNRISNALIILVPDLKDPAQLTFQNKVQDLASFSNGEWLFINTTKFKVRIDMNDDKLIINPDENSIFKAKITTEPTRMAMRYRPDNDETEKWKLISSSSVSTYDTRREICIFSWDERFKRIDYHGMTLPVM